MTPYALHPECPDVARLGPSYADGLLRARAARVELDRQQRLDRWGRRGAGAAGAAGADGAGGVMSRRRVLAGAGVAGAAGLASQLVTTRVSFAAPGPRSGSGTLVVIFLRGGMDGLSVVVPHEDPVLLQARPTIAVRGGSLLPLDRGFGLHPALARLHGHWQQGHLTAVPAVSTPDISRSHFQAQDCMERGGSATGATEGWLDRVLARLGPGTTFRAVGQGITLPRSLSGTQRALSLTSIERFTLPASEHFPEKTKQALTTLYTGIEHPLTEDVTTTLASLEVVDPLVVEGYQPPGGYPDHDFGRGMAEVARLIKGDVGLRVAAIDLGGWDMHTWLGTVDQGGMRNYLTTLDEALDAFALDIGSRLDGVTVVAMTEFGRRITENANAGTDHGHGGVVLLFGGGLAGGTVHGNWQGLASDVQDQGDVPGSNDMRNVLGEVVVARLGMSEADLATVFPGHRYQRIGVMA